MCARPVCLSAHPGTSSLVRLWASRCGGCRPLSGSDALVSPGERCHPRPPTGPRGHPGVASKLMRPPITSVHVEEAAPAVTPTFQSLPTSSPFLQKKELIMSKSQPRRTSERDLRRKEQGSAIAPRRPQTPLRKPAWPSPRPDGAAHRPRPGHRRQEMREKTSLITTNPCHFSDSANLN